MTPPAHGLAIRPLCWPADEPPRLLLVVDTEESFDWNAPLRGDGYHTGAVHELPRLQELATAHGMVPCYVVTWPLLTEAPAGRVLEELDRAGAEFGIHLHGWVTPPHGAPELEVQGFQGNLPPVLEAAKLTRMVEAFRRRFGRPPRIHKAGRYGLGPHTPGHLRRLGLELDLSPSPAFDYRHLGGPDFRHAPAGPARLIGADGSTVLALPTSGGFTGPLAGLGPYLFDTCRAGFAPLRALAQRGRLVRRLRLSPEGHDLDEMIVLARTLLAHGAGCLIVTLHSPSLTPGCTPYVRDRADRDRLLATLGAFLHWARSEAGLVPDRPTGVGRLWAGTGDGLRYGAADRPSTTAR